MEYIRHFALFFLHRDLLEAEMSGVLGVSHSKSASGLAAHFTHSQPHFLP
jgi:hypothetical protein